MMKQTILILICLCLAYPVRSQVTPPSFVRKEANRIADPYHTLYPFFEKLRNLDREKQKPGTLPVVIPIMHIGDSHIQAGFWNVTVMNRLQQRFGNAGRGLIFPLKLAHTNEPYDYLIRSGSQWDKSLCVQRSHKIPMGIGGLSIKTKDEHFTFDIVSSTRTKIDHSFNKVTVFHHEKAPKLHVSSSDVKCIRETERNEFTSIFQLNRNTHRLTLASSFDEKSDYSIYYGFSLENGKSGILYHAIGLNGAQFRHYASVQDFASQMSALTPELFIFSLGTNEAFRGKLFEKGFFAEIDRIIDPIRSANPQAKIIITTPPDCLSGSASTNRKSNPNIVMVRNFLMRYAQERKYACWDLYTLLGGENSAYKLYSLGYLASDGVHFKINGYTMLGNLLYDALIKSYADYVQSR